jgi:hypothetical protein
LKENSLFKRRSYQLIRDNRYTLIHYLEVSEEDEAKYLNRKIKRQQKASVNNILPSSIMNIGLNNILPVLTTNQAIILRDNSEISPVNNKTSNIKFILDKENNPMPKTVEKTDSNIFLLQSKHF